MNLTDSKYFLDTSAWISYFFAENKEIKNIIENPSLLLTSVISLFEIKRKLIKENLKQDKIANVLSFIKERSIIVKLEQNICEKAADTSIKEKLHATDSLIYSSAIINDSILVTLDLDFKNLKNIILIK